MEYNQRRELFVVAAGKDLFRPDVEDELKWLHDLLNTVEDAAHFCAAHEVIDLNNGKIITQPDKVKSIAAKNDFQPFIFVSNKN